MVESNNSDNRYFKGPLDNYILKENNNLFITFENKYFQNFIDNNNNLKNTFLEKMSADNRFDFKLIDLNSINNLEKKLENINKKLLKNKFNNFWNLTYFKDYNFQNRRFLFFPDYILENNNNSMLFRNDFIGLCVRRGNQPLEIGIYDGDSQNIETRVYVSDYPIGGKIGYMICVEW